MARQLGKGVFVASIGRFSYLVDCFATSTEWEMNLFQTDDAVLPADRDDPHLHLMDPDELDSIWPTLTSEPTPFPDDGVEGWLTPASKEPTQ